MVANFNVMLVCVPLSPGSEREVNRERAGGWGSPLPFFDVLGPISEVEPNLDMDDTDPGPISERDTVIVGGLGNPLLLLLPNELEPAPGCGRDLDGDVTVGCSTLSLRLGKSRIPYWGLGGSISSSKSVSLLSSSTSASPGYVDVRAGTRLCKDTFRVGMEYGDLAGAGVGRGRLVGLSLPGRGPGVGVVEERFQRGTNFCPG